MVLPTFAELKEKVIVITGGGGILCSSIADVLGAQGAKIAILDLKKENAQKISERINKNGGISIGIEANVLDLESLNRAKKEIHESLGTCDILINGAGGNHPKGTTTKSHLLKEDLEVSEGIRTFFDLDPEGIQFVFNLNFLGTLLPTQVFSKDMVGKKNCSVINFSSMNAFTPLTRIPAYSAAKASVSNFTQWLAVHFAKVGIRVNALAPGFFLTDQNRSLLTDENGNYTDRGTSILNNTPMNQFGEPEDLHGTVLWLCSEGSRFITGVIVPIDGGFSAYSGV